jgi:WD40 repeat protein
VLRRWNAATGEPVDPPLVGHTDWVRAVACAQLEDGRTQISSGGNDRSLILWPVACQNSPHV